MSSYLREAEELYKQEQLDLAQEAQQNGGNAEPQDEWDRRIDRTGCYVANMALQLCHADKNDWRACLTEMEALKKCWEDQGNNKRVHTVEGDGQ